ncbi:MAG: DNA polymerase III subunit delta' [Emcibacter sp.]|nr:DNA polymerase III subunit delta' [Emcibacter sp.]
MLSDEAKIDYEIIGHELSEKMFLDAYNSERLHHAWLITGPRGTGKALLAHKIARFLLHNPPEDNNDGPSLFGDDFKSAPITSLHTDISSYDNKLISAGSHSGMLVIERQPNEKNDKLKEEIVVDDVRKLQNFFMKTALDGGWRIVIIDSADEMNRNASNALLKALEEPPKNAILFLLAHAPGKLLPTITSRCRQIRLSPLSLQVVEKILVEKYPMLNADEIAGYAILSEGSPGYAIKLIENRGLELYTELLEILASLPMLDIPLVHKMADNLAKKGDDLQYFLYSEMLTSFINRMIRHVASVNELSKEESPIKAVLTGEFELMERLGQRISLDQWVDLWEKITHKMNQINLDRKQVILSSFALLSQRLN